MFWKDSKKATDARVERFDRFRLLRIGPKLIWEKVIIFLAENFNSWTISCAPTIYCVFSRMQYTKTGLKQPKCFEILIH